MAERASVENSVRAHRAALHALSSEIHANPEVSWTEHKASALVAQYMREQGFTVQHGAFDMPTAVYSEFVCGAAAGAGEHVPTIAFLAEYDALPGIGHACGHNLIAVSSMAAAIAFRDAVQERGIAARVLMLGTPAEETDGGKINMIDHGVFKNVDVALMAHPGTQNAIYGKWLAMLSLTVEFYGKPAHASANPWDGVNALDAAVMAYTSVSNLRQQTLPSSRIHGIIKHGGEAPNIIPEYTMLNYYIRTERIEDLLVLKGKVIKCFEGAASATGCTVKVTEEPTFANVDASEILNGAYKKHMQSYGGVFGDDSVTRNESRGSTDMGNVTQVVPAIHPVFDIGARGFAYHTSEFEQLAGQPSAFDCAMVNAQVLALTGLDCVTDPAHLAQIKQEFAAAHKH
ncbi:putative peptidase [Entophlyctis helioformis]|nr:putative peptidase [Entophlyctis helioformis]